jgi:hypothetical protein
MNRTRKDMRELFWYIKEHIRVKDIPFMFAVFTLLKEKNTINFNEICEKHRQICKIYGFGQLTRSQSLDIITDLNFRVVRFDIGHIERTESLKDIRTKLSD